MTSPGFRSIACTEKPDGRLPKCLRISMSWFLISRISGRGFIPTSPPWPTAWRRRPKREFPFIVLDRPNPIGGLPRRRPDAGCGQNILYRIYAASGAPRNDRRGTRALFQRGERDRGAIAGHCHERLAAILLFLGYRAALGESFAEYAQYAGGACCIPASACWSGPMYRSGAARTGRSK